MDLYEVLEPTLVGLGYEVVDLEMSNRGRLLRIWRLRAACIPGRFRSA